jgi:hypothetical protein
VKFFFPRVLIYPNTFIQGQYVSIIVPQYMNITTKFSTLKLLFFSFSSCLTIERSIVFKTMDRQCESFSRIFSSATGLDKGFLFIQNTWTIFRFIMQNTGKRCMILLVFIILRWSFNYESNVYRYNKILIDCVFENSKFVVPSTRQGLGDNKLDIPSYPVNKYILLHVNKLKSIP